MSVSLSAASTMLILNLQVLKSKEDYRDEIFERLLSDIATVCVCVCVCARACARVCTCARVRVIDR